MTNAREKEALAQPRYVRGQLLGQRFKNHSACTGKDCRLKNNCARVPKSIGVKYHGPLLHMFGADCIEKSKFVDAIDSHRRLEIRIQKKGQSKSPSLIPAASNQLAANQQVNTDEVSTMRILKQ